MKKLGAFLAITSLLTLTPAVFAAGGDAATPSLKDKRIVSSEASPDTRIVQQCEGQVGGTGELRSAGLCMGPDGALHFVPTTRLNAKLY
jgi:hypothetical protein